MSTAIHGSMKKGLTIQCKSLISLMASPRRAVWYHSLSELITLSWDGFLYPVAIFIEFEMISVKKAPNIS
jgi:hypothetical protein